MSFSEQLQKKIKEVVRIFPWYGSLMASKNVERLTDLPLMTAGILEQYYYNAAVPGAAGVYETSGTSANKRKIVSYSAEDEALYLDIKKKRFADFISGTGIKKVFIDVGTGHVCSTSGAIFESLGLKHLTIDINIPLEEHVRQLGDFSPDLLYMPPSLIDRILHMAPAPEIFGIKKIVPIGEVITENWLQKTAAAFGIKTSDFHFAYGATETGTMAVYSHDCGKYLLADGVHAEGLRADEIDSSLAPLPDDERIIVITTFNRKFFPGLRFVTYDVVRNFGEIKINGINRQCFDCIPRRVGTEFKHGERISIHDIENTVYKYLDRAVVSARVRDNRLTVGIISKELSNSVLKKIEEDIQSAVPEIGTMIKNGLLDTIKVEQLDENFSLDTGAAKKKRISSI